MNRSDATQALHDSVGELLERAHVVLGDLRLQELADQLSEPLYIVLMGEFNSGKSALVNTLLGSTATEEGVVPTTDRITLIRHGDPHPDGEIVRGRDLVEVTHPSPFLASGVCLVDTPGTNSVLERHARATEEFLHRAELVLFVISSERGFSASEREFLSLVRGRWDRKLLCVLNKIDILDDRGRDIVLGFVRDGFAQHLDVVPEIFAVSARAAREARLAGDEVGWRRSGVAALLERMQGLLAGNHWQRLKVEGALGALESILWQRATGMRDRHAALLCDLERLSDQAAALERAGDRELESVLGRWRAAVDLAYLEEVESRVATLGRLLPIRAVGGRSAAGTAEETALVQRLESLARDAADACARLEQEVSPAVPSAPPTSLELTGNESIEGVRLPAAAIAGAGRRLRGWVAGTGLTASGLVAAGILGAVQVPVAVFGTAGAGVVGLWRRGVERGRLERSLGAARDSTRLRGEATLRAIFAAHRARVSERLDPLLATVIGERAELSDSLSILDELAQECWELRQQLDTAYAD